MEDKDYINSVSPAPNPAVTFKAATGIVFDKAGNLYISCRYGLVYRIKRGETKATIILDIQEEVAGYGDHGLLGITLDRDHLTNGRFYVYYVVDMYYYDNFGKPGYSPNQSTDNIATIGRLTRYTVNPNNDYKVDPASRKILIGETLETGIPIVTASHAGGGLSTGVDGSILLGTGDAASFVEVDVGCNNTTWFQQGIDKKIIKTTPSDACNTYSLTRLTENIGAYKAQVLYSLNGKILRINPENGEGYPSNPFYMGTGTDLKLAQNRVYALGLRQAFRLSVRPNTGDANPANGNPGVLYVGDVGFSTFEELNVVTAPGQNFGWPYFEGQERGREGYYKTEIYKPANPVKPRIQYRDNKNTEIMRDNEVVSSNTRPLEGNCIVGGVWHEGGGNYPKEFQDTYYFADYGTGWIAGAHFGHDNNMEAGSLFKMATKMTVTEYSDRIVGMAFNPVDRNVYYITLGEKSLVRQFAFTTNQPPTAVITKDKEFGNSPLSINFSAKDSFDPEGGTLSYEWNFGDGSSKDLTATPPLKTFTNGAQKTYTVTLKVTDNQGKSSTDQAVISLNNTPPTVQSTSVDGYSQISLPQTINLSATATDAQTPADQLKYQWTVYLYHNDHRHTVSIFNGSTGSINLTEGNCDGEASYWYGMELAVTDGGGLTTTYTKYIYLSCAGQAQTITFDPIANKAPNTAPFRPPVSASSGLTISLYVVDGPAVIENGQIKLTGGIGLVTVRAAQHGNNQYKYAQPVERSFMVTTSAPSTPDTQAPTAPSGLAASNITATSLQLNWNASTDNVGITGYDVYQGNTKINVNIVNGTTFAVTGLTPSTAYTFKVIARDAASNSSGNSNTANATTLAAPSGNQPPVVPSGLSLNSATVNQAYTSNALAAFTDPEGDALTYTLTGLPNGLSFNAGNRTVSGTATATGTFSLTYAATDNQHTPVTTTVTLTVSGTATIPIGNLDGYLTQDVNCNTLSGWAWDRTNANAPVTIEFFDGASIAAGTPLGSILADVFQQHLKDAGKGNGAHWYDFPIPESVKTSTNHTIWARVQGSEFVLKWAPKTINCVGTGTPPANQPPIPPSVSSLSAFVNTSFTSAPLATFTDPESTPLTYTLTGLPNNLTFNASTRVVSGTPATTGTFSLTYSATDQPGAKNSVVFPLVVNEASNPPDNDPPVAPAVSPLSATVNVAFTASALPVFTDTDPLTYSLTGLPNGLSFNTTSRVISGTPTQQGTFTLTYVANDGKVTEDVTFTLTVAAGGTGNPVVTGNFEGYLDIVNCNTFSGWIWDRDKANTPITIEFLDGATVAGSTLIDPILANTFRQDLQTAGKGNGAHGYSYVVPERLKDNQTHTIWARVQGSDYILKWAPKTINCVGTGTPPANAAPVAPAVSPLSATVNVGFTASALPVFTDAESDALTYTLNGLPNGVSFNASTRVISGTPAVSGAFTLTYSATDNKHSPVSTTLTLTVSAGGGNPPSNDPPVTPSVSPLSATVNVAFTASALPVFTDTDPLTYSLTGLPNGLNFNTSTRVISGTPTQQGTFTLTYVANDGQATEDVTFTLTVAAGGTTTPPAPAANYDGYLGKDINCNSLGGWAWERAKGNNVVTIEFFEGASIAAGRYLGAIQANIFRQDLLNASKGNGIHGFDYPIPDDIKDGQNHTIWARVQGSEFVLKDSPKTINCPGSGTPSNAAPVAPSVSPLSATINVGFTASALPVFTDAESDALTYTLTGLPNGLSFNASTRVISGTPTVSGTFTLTYSATDNKHSPVSTTLTLTVNTAGGTPPPTNAAPVAPSVSPLSATINAGFTASALPVFTDAESDALTYTLTGLPNGVSFNASTRVISGTPTVSGTFTLTYSATDNKHSPVSTTLTLTVNTAGGNTSGGSGPGNYEGYLDVVDCNTIQGWLWDRNRVNTPITVEFVEGSTVVGATDANIFRQDLKTAGKGDGIHGYSYIVPASLKDGKPHSISGRVPGGNFTLKWSPKTLNCPVGSRQGVNEHAEISMSLTVSPNPSRGRVEISYLVEAEQWADLQVVDMMGRQIWQKPMIGTGKIERETIDLSSAGASIYLIQLQTAKQIVTRRLLINR
jgi:chitodextrinase